MANKKNQTMANEKNQTMNQTTNSKNEFMLTTIDNPFNPFTQFDEWFQFDSDKSYGTCNYLARIAKTSDSLSDEENAEEINNAIDEIIKYDFMHIYKKISRNASIAA